MLSNLHLFLELRINNTHLYVKAYWSCWSERLWYTICICTIKYDLLLKFCFNSIFILFHVNLTCCKRPSVINDILNLLSSMVIYDSFNANIFLDPILNWPTRVSIMAIRGASDNMIKHFIKRAQYNTTPEDTCTKPDYPI